MMAEAEERTKMMAEAEERIKAAEERAEAAEGRACVVGGSPRQREAKGHLPDGEAEDPFWAEVKRITSPTSEPQPGSSGRDEAPPWGPGEDP